MNAIDCIKTRRSIRKFEDRPVRKDLIEDLVVTASYAPTWKNTQTTRYIAVTDPELRRRSLPTASWAMRATPTSSTVLRC